MAQRTDVDWPTCDQAGCIGIRLASARVCLAHGSEEETAAALKLVGDTGAIEARGVHITRALLDRLLTAAPRGENGMRLIKGGQFRGATFSGDALFGGATFQVGFLGAAFQGDAQFDGAAFERAQQFGPLLACEGLDSDVVQFAQPVRIIGSLRSWPVAVPRLRPRAGSCL